MDVQVIMTSKRLVETLATTDSLVRAHETYKATPCSVGSDGCRQHGTVRWLSDADNKWLHMVRCQRPLSLLLLAVRRKFSFLSTNP